MTTATPDKTTGDVEVGYPIGWQLREGVCDDIRGLGLAGMPDDRVHHVTIPRHDGHPTPYVMVSKTRGAFSVGPGTNAREDHRYAVLVLLVRASSRSTDGSTQNARQLDEWFEAVAKKYSGSRPGFLLEGGCILSTKVIDNDPQMAAKWIQQLDAAYLVLHFNVREDRHA